MRAALRPAAALAATLLLALASGAAPAPDAAGDKARAQCAAAVMEFARACVKAGAAAEARAALAEARSLDAAVAGADALAREIDGLGPSSGDEGDLRRLRRASGPAVAKAYDRLAALPRPAGEGAAEEAAAAAAAAALRWDPSAARVGKVLAAAEEHARTPLDGGVAIASLRRLDLEPAVQAKVDAAEQRLAQSGLLVVGSAKTDMVGLLSLPKGWARGKRFPVLVACDGAGSAFVGAANGFAAARGSRAVMVFTPVSLSNTNQLDAGKRKAYGRAYPASIFEKYASPGTGRLAFDGPGLVALLDELEGRFGAERAVFATGFSGGGILAYWLLFQHPSRVRGAAPACANFTGGEPAGGPGAGEGGGPPVHILTGEKDEHREFTFGDRNQPGIEPQTDRAVEALRAAGFTRVRRTMVKGAGHSSLAGEVWKFVDEVLAGK